MGKKTYPGGKTQFQEPLKGRLENPPYAKALKDMCDVTGRAITIILAISELRFSKIRF